MKKNAAAPRKLSTLLDRDNVAGYVFILPFIIGVIAFTAIPFFTSLYLAFTDYQRPVGPQVGGPCQLQGNVL